MTLSGIGTVNTYVYNSTTGRLSSKDAKDDEFVGYYNGDLSAEETTTLNGFDAVIEGGIKTMIRMFREPGMFQSTVFDDSSGDVYEITGEIVDAVTSVYYVNGEKVWTQYLGVCYTDEEFNSFNKPMPYKTYQSQGYDPATNSINIAVGDTIDLGSGYRLRVKGDHVEVIGLGRRGGNNDVEAERLSRLLDAFIHIADQQWSDSMIEQSGGNPMMLALLRELGVDTSREFTVNGTKFEVVNGEIREVGNTYCVPMPVYNRALKRYEEALSLLFADQ